MADGVDLRMGPRPRCFWLSGHGASSPCGRDAVAIRPGRTLEMPVLVCGRHARPGDLPLAPEQPFRRVRVSLVVDVAATSWNESVAVSHAVCELEAALRALGGVTNVLNATSRIVHPGTPAGALDATAAADKG